jgi:hypothetical protein
MSSDPRSTGHGPDNLGDEEQDTEVSEYEYYLEDPPDDLIIAEDGDDDAEEAADWAARHPRAATAPDVPDDVSAEESAMHETRGD